MEDHFKLKNASAHKNSIKNKIITRETTDAILL